MMAVTAQGTSMRGSRHILQDVWGAAGNCAWVIDGATRSSAAENDIVAAWVQSLSQAIATHARATEDPSELRVQLMSAIEDARIPGSWHPSATVALTSLNATGLAVLVLGDAGVLIPGTDNGLSLLQDTRLHDVAAEIRRKRKKAKADGDLQQYNELSRMLLEEEDRWRNRDGGFWVAADDPTAAERAMGAWFPLCTGVSLMSDGALNEVGRALGSAAEAWTRLSLDVVGAVRALRKEVMKRDNSCDDMTAVVCQWIQ